MPAFEYIAVDGQGRKTRGLHEADSARQVRQSLRDKGLIPVEVRAAAREQKSAPRSLWKGSRRISAYDLALFTRQLATLVQAGIPLEEALRAVSRQHEKPQVQSILLAVRGKVLEGYTLAQSLADFPGAFPELYRATVAAGEQSGHLDLVLQQLADYTESRFEMRKKIQHAMIYPAILTILSLLIVVALLTWVVPDIVRVFETSEQTLPFITRALIAVSDFFKHYLWLLVLALVIAGYFFRKALQENAVRERFDAWQLGLPFAGKLIRNANAARLASTLSILGRSGVPLVEGLRISAEVMSNLTMRHAVRTAALRVTEGGSLAGALEQTGHFPPMMLQMIASGEQSGELDDMLARAASMQERELSSLVATLVGLFEPLMLLMMAGVVLLIVLAIMLPIVSMNNLVS